MSKLLLFPPLHLSHARTSIRLHPHHRRLRRSAAVAAAAATMNRRWNRALGQRLNPAGLISFIGVAAREPHLALPHAAVPDIRWVDWSELARLGFRGVVFDKDNTLTAPYSPDLWPPLDASLRSCRAAFPGRVAVFSNSAGLYQYDPDGSEARAVEESIGGIHVVRHEMKKPAGTAEEIEEYFGCPASLLVMVGDRYFTDVVYGNRNGFLTIITKPLSLSGEPFIVKQNCKWMIGNGSSCMTHGYSMSLLFPFQVRKMEGYLVDRWSRKGLKPLKHNLVYDPKQCLKVPPL